MTTTIRRILISTLTLAMAAAALGSCGKTPPTAVQGADLTHVQLARPSGGGSTSFLPLNLLNFTHAILLSWCMVA